MLTSYNLSTDGHVKTDELRLVRAPHLFHVIAERIECLLDDLVSEMNFADRDYLERRLELGENTGVDYDHFALPFAYSYFLKNFWKASCTFLREPPPLASSVIDAGCGSGATALAYLAATEDSLHQTPWNIEVQLIDRSPVQLALARRILTEIQIEFHNLNVTLPTPVCIDLRNWTPKSNSADCILFGYVLTANRSDVDLFLAKAYTAATNNGRIYIIEPRDDIVWDAIKDWTSKMALQTSDGIGEMEVKDLDLPFGLSTIHGTRLRPRYSVLHLPEQKELRLITGGKL